MLVTVVRSRTGEVVELPGGINIRPHNFVELKSLDVGMKEALALLEKAGTVQVAQVADVSDVMLEGSIENRMPSDTTGAASAMFLSDAERKAHLERVAGMSDNLTDYSRSHALSADELAKRKQEVDEKVSAAEATGPGGVVQRVVTVTAEDLLAERERVKSPSAKPATVEAAKERLGDGAVELVKKRVEDVTVGSKASVKSASASGSTGHGTTSTGSARPASGATAGDKAAVQGSVAAGKS